ncbi:MAG: hypothetical protein ACREVK_08460 [Gammaproteobacteria bacterium]
MSMAISETIAEAAQAFWKELPLGVRLSGKALVYFPIFAKGITAGLMLPDLDLCIPGVGIGGHRWAVTHSAFAAYLGREGVKVITRYLDGGAAQSALKQALVAAGTGFCLGISIHLLKDALWDNDQSIRFAFPFLGGPGTLVEGTYVDDDAWLAGNGLFAIKCARDLILFGFGEDFNEARRAFDAYCSEREIRKKIDEARRKARAEAKMLREVLGRAIPTDTDAAPTLPAWIGAR